MCDLLRSLRSEMKTQTGLDLKGTDGGTYRTFKNETRKTRTRKSETVRVAVLYLIV